VVSARKSSTASWKALVDAIRLELMRLTEQDIPSKAGRLLLGVWAGPARGQSVKVGRRYSSRVRPGIWARGMRQSSKEEIAFECRFAARVHAGRHGVHKSARVDATVGTISSLVGISHTMVKSRIATVYFILPDLSSRPAARRRPLKASLLSRSCRSPSAPIFPDAPVMNTVSYASPRPLAGPASDASSNLPRPFRCMVLFGERINSRRMASTRLSNWRR